MRHKLGTFALSLLLSVSAFGADKVDKTGAKMKNPTVFWGSIPPSSLDPSDGDYWNNIPLLESIYATPIHHDINGNFSSFVLDSFDYNPSTKTVTLVRKKKSNYSDGSSITVEDIAFSLVRTAKLFPNLPHISGIRGLEKWHNEGADLTVLPQGIQVIGDTIKIEFSGFVSRPLIGFTLPLFSIVPKRVFDLKTGKLRKEETPPSSGPYRIVAEKGKRYTLQIRPEIDDSDLKKAPPVFNLEFINSKELLDIANRASIDDAAVGMLPAIWTRKDVENLRESGFLRLLGSAQFGGLVINPEQEPWKSQMCRLFFGELIQNKIKNDATGNYPAEGGIFTKIMSGYKSLDELRRDSSIHISDADRAECIRIFRSNPFIIAHTHSEKNRIRKYLAEIVTDLKLPPLQEHLNQSWDDFTTLFISGQTNLAVISSGFWPDDVLNDFRMFFSEGTHPVIKFIAGLTETKSALKEVTEKIDPHSRSQIYRDYNQKLFDSGLYITVSHTTDFIYSKRNRKSVLNSSDTYKAPQPWQILSHD